MGEWYHFLPSHVSPIAVQFGPFAIHWYSLMWLCAGTVVFLLLRWRIRRAEGTVTVALLDDVMVWAFLGALVGGRVGYVLLYDVSYYLAHPLAIFSPYDFVAGTWSGIYGMSYHGGLVGVALGVWHAARQHHANVWRVLDFMVPAIPAGYFFGRVGNFFNHELVGRATVSPFGMYFNGEHVLRHPSQLYEAVAEGIVLFVILWPLRNRVQSRGVLTALYVMLYGVVRFVCEFLREPDAHLGFVGYGMTMGQVLSVLMIVGAGGTLICLLRDIHRQK